MNSLPLVDTDIFDAGGSSAFSLLGLIVGVTVNGLIVVVVGIPLAVWRGARRLVRALGV